MEFIATFKNNVQNDVFFIDEIKNNLSKKHIN